MIELTDTNSSKIAAEFIRSRTRAGSPAMGMVMTLVIVAPEDDAAEAMRLTPAEVAYVADARDDLPPLLYGWDRIET